jgi:VanZ family protein
LEADKSSPHLSSLRTFLKYNLLAILWGLLIVVLTLLPGNAFPRLPVFMDLLHPDKLIHLFIFTVYVILQTRGFVMQPGSPFLRRNAALLSIMIGITLGAGTELMQDYFVPMRNGSIYDFIANVVGCLLGCGITKKLKISN